MDELASMFIAPAKMHELLLLVPVTYKVELMQLMILALECAAGAF